MNASFKIKNFDYIIALTSYFLIALFILNQILFSPGTVGFFHDWPIGPYPEMNRFYANGGLYVWNSQLGNTIYFTDWIFRLSLIPFSFLGGEVLTKGLLTLIITLSGFGSFCLGRQLKLSTFSSFAAGVLFIFSPIVFTRIVAGYIYYLIAYFLSPLILTLFLKGKEKEEKNIKYKYFIAAGILTSFAVIQLQFLVLIFVVLLIFSLVDFRNIKLSALGLIVIFSIASLIDLSPIVFSQTLTKNANSYSNPLQLTLSYYETHSAPNLTKSLRLLGYEGHPYSYTRLGTNDDPLFESDILKIGNKSNLVTNPDFILAGDSSNSNIQSGLPASWNDPIGSCNSVYRCTVIKSTTPRSQGTIITSFQISTALTHKNKWSFIEGRQIDVGTGEQYAFITHMKLNEFARGSHVAIEGYNETSKDWDEIAQCPSGTDGPLQWRGFGCAITIPANTTKIRPVLNAGWSSQPGKEAITWFDSINITKLYDPSVIIPSWVFYLDFLLPIVGFSALIFRKDKYTLSFAVISLIGLFLLKGLNPPFPSIFTFIFIHGFYIFRELWHIAFLYAFGISFLIAFFLERVIISSRIKNSSTLHQSFYKSIYNLKNYFKFIVPSILTLVIVISNGYPLLIGNFGGYLQTYNFPEEYHKLYDHLLTNSTYNTLILPLFTPIHYDGLKLEGLDPLVLDSANNIFEQLAFNLPSNPVTGLSTWLHSVMQENKTNNFGKLLSGFGIKYIILRKDFISNYPNYNDLGSYIPFTKRWYHSLEPFLNAQKDLIVISNTSHYTVFENINAAKKLFVPVAVASGLSDFNDLLYISNFTSLSNVVVYPIDKHTPLYDFIDLGQYTSSFNATEGWTTNRDWFGFNYLLASRVNVGAFTMSNDSTFSFDLSLSKYNDKPVEIWMKAFTWSNGNLIGININGKESSYNLYSPHDGFSLIKIFDGKNVNANYNFQIRNIAGDNYVEGIYIKEKGIESDQSIKNKISVVGIEDENNLVSNPDFVYVSNQSGLPLYWNDSLKSCRYVFKCTITSIDEWKGNTSFQLSTNTTSTNNETWSWIRGKEINVKPGEQYAFTTHMKLNEFARGSHIKLEGNNETSKGWNELKPQCPSGTDGPLQWHEFGCVITIPKDTSKIRPVLNAGWSSEPGKEAVTWFDAIDVSTLHSESRVRDLTQLKEHSGLILKGYNEFNPTLWNVRINNPSKSFVLSFAESYDPLWEARVYKDGKKVDTVKSTPIYGVTNGFQINQTGNLDIVLRYTRQDWYETGLIVSAITFAFCMFYLFYEWRRTKQDKWAEKVETKIRQVSKIKSINFKKSL